VTDPVALYEISGKIAIIALNRPNTARARR
jgi:hypothetical protein